MEGRLARTLSARACPALLPRTVSANGPVRTAPPATLRPRGHLVFAAPQPPSAAVAAARTVLGEQEAPAAPAVPMLPAQMRRRVVFDAEVDVVEVSPLGHLNKSPKNIVAVGAPSDEEAAQGSTPLRMARRASERKPSPGALLPGNRTVSAPAGLAG
eukprot:CAMPEP_0204592468 /NCGR_PEP_ID=MMETSP0661-20131031/50960_1 /ASSEMBLY_ACC=CAM_ASM_000606 /TAXON_ID=109239 /ORGANISM="Alexandrium margalefi, Strain AMGDE01CS-322" /LENGTH=156 /DNA_ID=CAMNT_0051602699 /DNA_START=92 /DNA_END=558 /DNA_ORIENTATION=-